jgi:hypothetical protein
LNNWNICDQVVAIMARAIIGALPFRHRNYPAFLSPPASPAEAEADREKYFQSQGTKWDEDHFVPV